MYQEANRSVVNIHYTDALGTGRERGKHRFRPIVDAAATRKLERLTLYSITLYEFPQACTL